MKFLIVLTVCLVSALAAPQFSSIPDCKPANCKLPACKCSEAPRGNNGTGPQFLVLSFDDALSKEVYEEFIRPMFVARRNPDNCPISGTFFVPHEYTDYSVVNMLYRRGYEIGSHSITKHHLQAYWRNATTSVLQAEFDGQRKILSKFANIPDAQITGVRVPQLQLNPFTFSALKASNFSYDSSWPTLQNRSLAPYTLDYKSNQVCHTLHCQEISTPGLWEMPIVDWIDQHGENCNNIDACAVVGTENVIFEWMKKNFHDINNKGVPVSFRPNFSWFNEHELNRKALVKFLDYIGTLNNTFIVSNAQVLEWSKNPSDKFTSCQGSRKAPCSPITCRLQFGSDWINMVACNSCPKSYPWLNNPYCMFCLNVHYKCTRNFEYYFY